MPGVTAMSQNRSCGSYGPGHLMHWIEGKKSHEDGQPNIKVKVVAVHDDGRVEIEGDELKLTLWYHDPDRLRSALFFGGLVWMLPTEQRAPTSCSSTPPTSPHCSAAPTASRTFGATSPT